MNAKAHTNMFTKCVLVASLVMLSACGSVNQIASGDKINYRGNLQTTSSLEVPPTIDFVRSQPNYAAPDSQTFSQLLKQRQAKESGGVLPSTLNARIEKDGQRRWLVINQPAEDVWPRLEKFWLDMGFTLEVKSAETGIMETNWLENKKGLPGDGLKNLLGSLINYVTSSDKKDKFRTRIERNKNETEIYVTHYGAEEDFIDKNKDVSKWSSRASEPEIEAEILRKMMLSLGLNAEQSNFLANNYQNQPANYTKNNTQTAAINNKTLTELNLMQTQGNAWRLVGMALDRANFNIAERNLEKNYYIVEYIKPETFNQQTGFWDRVKMGKNAESLRRAKPFKILIEANNSASTVKVVSEHQDDLSHSRILKVIQENL